MLKVRVSKKFTVNMGNYESYAVEVEAELPVRETYDDAGRIHDNSYREAFQRAHDTVDEAVYKDIEEAAKVSDVRNTYVLTWLKNREGIISQNA